MRKNHRNEEKDQIEKKKRDANEQSSQRKKGERRKE